MICYIFLAIAIYIGVYIVVTVGVHDNPDSFMLLFLSRKSITYQEDRLDFLHAVTNNDVTIEHDILTIDESEGLYTDIVTFRGDNSSLLIHISGTHGVEGYVGSFIQQHLLYEYKHDPQGPTVMFVHGLNPYGMAHYRRVNENNVDLNRNAIFTESEWRDVMFSSRKDSSKYRSHRLNLVNPVETCSCNGTHGNGDGSWFNLMWNIISEKYHGTWSECKRDIIRGKYNKNVSHELFYGGVSLEKSHRLLKNHLETKGYLDSVKKLVLLDVHTGQGPFAMDTLMVSKTTTESHENLENYYNYSYHVAMTPKPLNPLKTNDTCTTATNVDAVSEGYDGISGIVADNYPKLFPHLTDTISITQEFGTYHPLIVIIGLMEENRCYNETNNETDIDQPWLIPYKIFSPLHNNYFSHEVEHRGKKLFYKSLDLWVK